MRIVLANKFWRPQGGADKYALDLAALAAQHGDVTIPFAMADQRNELTPWARFFVSPVQTDRVAFSLGGLKTAARTLWSFEAARKFGRLIEEAKPDVVHVHNIYRQISPSILPEAARRGVPVVMTVHDYALIAPSYTLWHDGAICEVTKPRRYFRAVEHLCVKHSSVASMLVAMEMTLHRWLGVWDHVDLFIAPSRFVKAMLAEYGVPENKITHIPHFIDAAAWTPSYGPGSYALYVGRLSDEKGVATLIRAAALAKEVPVHVVGGGPEAERFRKLALAVGATNVTFRGELRGAELRGAYAGARFQVVPSEWYEPFGLIVLEAYASGKPVLASQIGALAELVLEGETGRFAAAGQPADLAARLSELWADPTSCEVMGRAARELVERDYTPAEHYERVKAAYATVLDVMG